MGDSNHVTLRRAALHPPPQPHLSREKTGRPCPLPIVAERLRTLARHACVWNTAPISNSSRRDDGGTHTASYATALPSNPNGILAHSPRLAPQRLPWVIIPQSLSTPTGLRPCVMPLPGLASTTSRLPKRPPIPDQRWRLPPAPAVRHHCRTPNPIESFSPVGPASSRKRAIRYRSSTGLAFAFGSACHHQPLVPPAEQMPKLPMPAVKPRRVIHQTPSPPNSSPCLARPLPFPAPGCSTPNFPLPAPAFLRLL